MVFKVRLQVRSCKLAAVIRLKGDELLLKLAFSIRKPSLDDRADLAFLLQGESPDVAAELIGESQEISAAIISIRQFTQIRVYELQKTMQASLGMAAESDCLPCM